MWYKVSGYCNSRISVSYGCLYLNWQLVTLDEPMPINAASYKPCSVSVALTSPQDFGKLDHREVVRTQRNHTVDVVIHR